MPAKSTKSVKSAKSASAVRTEDPTAYQATPPAPLSADERAVIDRALEILNRRVMRASDPLTSPGDVKNYLRLRIGFLEHEVFGALWMDHKHRVIACEEMFRGTIDGASVHPREVVKTALAHNASAVVFYHNHPSGSVEPSQADLNITVRLNEALRLIDLRVLDHFIVGESCTSFAERGLL